MSSSNEPVFNVPRAVTLLLLTLALVHVARTYLLTEAEDIEVLGLFSFIPARYTASVLGDPYPGGVAAQLWTFVTYAFLHADFTHIAVNSIWLLAFGTPVARRFGAARFSVFFAVTAAAGALAHLAGNAGDAVPVIGASASISGMMAAALRFAFMRGGALSGFGRDERAYRMPALPLSQTLLNPAVVIFLVVWFGLNLLLGVSSNPMVAAGQTVAWEAHIGGFLSGLFLFPLFDPIPPPADRDLDSDSDQNAETPVP